MLSIGWNLSSSVLAVVCLTLLAAFGVQAVTQSSKARVAKVVDADAAPAGSGRVMGKRYKWEMESNAMLAKSTFKIKPSALIQRAKEVIDKDILDADDLAEDFVFQFPVVGPLSKAEYLKAVGGFQIKTMFPDMNPGIHNFHVDPLQPNRVWYTVVLTATNSGDGPFGPPTNTRVDCPPQVNSLAFNEEGKVIKYTGGYVTDKDIGNTGGMGGLFGLLYAIGKPFPFPEAKPYTRSWQFRLFNFVGSIAQKFAKKE